LAAEHRQIAAMARELAATVSGSVLPDPLVFLQFRREFGRVLTRHLKREEWAVYPQLTAHRDGRVRALAEQLCADSQRFSADFAAYAGRWTAAKIAADWEGFRVETLEIIGGLLDRIDAEDNRLYPLLAEEQAAPCAEPAKFAA